MAGVHRGVQAAADRRRRRPAIVCCQAFGVQHDNFHAMLMSVNSSLSGLVFFSIISYARCINDPAKTHNPTDEADALALSLPDDLTAKRKRPPPCGEDEPTSLIRLSERFRGCAGVRAGSTFSCLAEWLTGESLRCAQTQLVHEAQQLVGCVQMVVLDTKRIADASHWDGVYCEAAGGSPMRVPHWGLTSMPATNAASRELVRLFPCSPCPVWDHFACVGESTSARLGQHSKHGCSLTAGDEACIAPCLTGKDRPSS